MRYVGRRGGVTWVDFWDYMCGFQGLRVLVSEIACTNFRGYGGACQGLQLRVFGTVGPVFGRTVNLHCTPALLRLTHCNSRESALVTLENTYPQPRKPICYGRFAMILLEHIHI